MSDRDDYNTAEDALHLRRHERLNAETRLSNARNEVGRAGRISFALDSLPDDAGVLDMNRAIWKAAKEQAESWESALEIAAAGAITAENEAVAKVNAIATRLMAERDNKPEARSHGPTYLVLLRQGADSIAILLYAGTDELVAREEYDAAVRESETHGEGVRAVYLTTVRAEAKLS